MNYQYTFEGGSGVMIKSGLGLSHDDFHAKRLSGLLEAEGIKMWGEHFQTTLAVRLSSVSGYQSSGAELLLGWKP